MNIDMPNMDRINLCDPYFNSDSPNYIEAIRIVALTHIVGLTTHDAIVLINEHKNDDLIDSAVNLMRRFQKEINIFRDFFEATVKE